MKPTFESLLGLLTLPILASGSCEDKLGPLHAPAKPSNVVQETEGTVSRIFPPVLHSSSLFIA